MRLPRSVTIGLLALLPVACSQQEGTARTALSPESGETSDATGLETDEALRDEREERGEYASAAQRARAEYYWTEEEEGAGNDGTSAGEVTGSRSGTADGTGADLGR